ncbi:hypothetical protein ACE1AT_11155 [Pelatocladus sp. BLCC-F211]|uniref:hypothetical protein n=1 Tax=Pelatocladus sp. BLCC-F211 TaxID=3342752 RepID=UPI0035BB99E0
MATGIFTSAWITESAKILYRGGTPPDVSKFRVCLANTAVLTRASTLADFIGNELLPSNGYTRSSVNFGSDGSYDTTDQRHELPFLSPSFTASGASLQFQTAFLLANSHSVASLSFTNSNVDAVSDRITINNHGLVNGDRLVFTADALATLPGGIAASTLYQVANKTTNDFQLQLVGGSSIVDIANTGSGTFRARAANGIVVAYGVETSPITIPDGQTYAYQIPIVLLNSGYINGT